MCVLACKITFGWIQLLCEWEIISTLRERLVQLRLGAPASCSQSMYRNVLVQSCAMAQTSSPPPIETIHCQKCDEKLHQDSNPVECRLWTCHGITKDAIVSNGRNVSQWAKLGQTYPILRAGSRFCSLVLFTLCDHLCPSSGFVSKLRSLCSLNWKNMIFDLENHRVSGWDFHFNQVFYPRLLFPW